MRNGERTQFAGAMGRILLAYALIFSQGAWAGQSQNTKDKPESNGTSKSRQAQASLPAAAAAKAQSAKEETTAVENPSAQENSRRGGQHEGIKVHGHWTIEVRDPSGQVVTHREFENSLFPSPSLASIFARQNSVGFWSVFLNPGTVCGNTNNAGCSIGEAAQTSAAHNSSNLAATVVGNSFVLSGTFVAATAGTITMVETDGFGCPATIAPSAPCQFGTTNFGFGADGGFIFTQANLNPGISVAAGQTVAVTVNISFS